MPHDPLTTSRIHFLAQTILNQPHYGILKAPTTFTKSRELYEWDLDRLNVEMKLFKTELFEKGFIAENYTFYLQTSGFVAIDGFEHFSFKMLRSDGTWYGQEPNN
jgi:hypothetical protein